ncbi:hypothetical protein R1flu_007081 [Riccia fluitans]|uniref:Uncharacterized protein n=1 Tax=Riccia fluitans TaxID=41844 RepID=A0ABD1Z1Z1_9MARC
MRKGENEKQEHGSLRIRVTLLYHAPKEISFSETCSWKFNSTGIAGNDSSKNLVIEIASCLLVSARIHWVPMEVNFSFHLLLGGRHLPFARPFKSINQF